MINFNDYLKYKITNIKPIESISCEASLSSIDEINVYLYYIIIINNNNNKKIFLTLKCIIKYGIRNKYNLILLLLFTIINYNN